MCRLAPGQLGKRLLVLHLHNKTWLVLKMYFCPMGCLVFIKNKGWNFFPVQERSATPTILVAVRSGPGF